MADGSAPQGRSAEDGSDSRDRSAREGPAGRPLPLSVRLLGAGVRGARTVGKAAGIDRAVQAATEEAMVAAVESEAVERALVRVLQGPLVEEAVNGALESETVKRALVEALDSEMVDEVWRRLLASDEAQRLVERIAEAPELRAAISAQSVGFLEDVGHTIGDTTHRIDGAIERVVRRIFFRPQRSEPTERAGAVTRALAFALDVLVVNLAFSGLAAIAALIASAFAGDGVSGIALVLGGTAWFFLEAFYFVVFWSLAGQTLGMRFFGIRLGVEGRGLPFRCAVRRLAGLILAGLAFGLGFLGILFDERRRGWQDRLAGVDVLYEGNEPAAAPWSRLDALGPTASGESGAPADSAATKAQGARGLRSQQIAGPPLGG
jgi:uncharacterized RDD family membrane protein YckC